MYLLICLMLWQLTVAIIKAGTITYQKKNIAWKGVEIPGVPIPAVSDQCMNFPAIFPHSVQPGLSFPIGLILCPQSHLPHNFLPVLQTFARIISVFQCAGAVKVKCKAKSLGSCSHTMPLTVRAFRIKISCYVRFPEPDFWEMEGAQPHTAHGPNTAPYSASFHVRRTLDLKALENSSFISGLITQ